VLGNIGGSTCVCLYGSALWNRVALGSSIEDRTQRNPHTFFLFLGHCHSYFPIFHLSLDTLHCASALYYPLYPCLLNEPG